MVSLQSLKEKAEQARIYNIFTQFDPSWLSIHIEEQAGIDGPLSGKVIAIKDNINVRGLNASCGSAMLKDYRSLYDATVIRKLKEAGVVIIGKTNMDEFAMGSSNEYSCFGPVKNPVNPDYVPGGSSGGSAAAVASGIVDYALGSDTGGSIRQPAAYTGVVGLKPTYGRVSRYGLTAFASSLDQIGPITKTVRQCAEILQVISGFDEHDATSVPKPVDDYPALIQRDLSGLSVGVPFGLLNRGVGDEMLAAFERTLDTLRAMGVTTKEVDLPNGKYAIAAYYILATAEASSNLARFDGIRYGHRTDKKASNVNEFFSVNREEGFGAEVKRRIMLGTYVLSSGYYDAFYGKAQKVRRLIFDDFQKAFTAVDAVVIPTSPTPAFRLGEKSNDPLQMYLNDIFTVSVNIAGIPAVSIPMGHSADKLPLGFQIIGKPFDEGTILRIGHNIEQKYE